MISTLPQPRLRLPFVGGMLAVVTLALANFFLHFYFNNRYHVFRDEFDYMICGARLAWGYVDQPPLIPFLIRASRAVFGDSLRSIRLVPALASSITLIQTGVLARSLGGKSYALVLAATAYLVSPQYLSNGSLLTTNCLEPLLWMACVQCVIFAIQKNDPRYWLWFGVFAGIGMQEKYSIGVLGFAVVVGLLLTPERRFLWNRWIWLGGLAAFLIFLPNLLWNIHYDFPFLQLMHNIRANGRDIALTPTQYIAQQILIMNPATALLWIPGLIALLAWKPLQPYRLLGWTYLATLTVFIVLHGKNYYCTPIYPYLLAAGAVLLEHCFCIWRQAWLKPALPAVLLVFGSILAPFVIPVLSPESFLVYMSKLPIQAPRQEHSQVGVPLPQHYADQFGWEEMVAVVNQAWQSIPQQERNDCGIFGQNYGQSGAVDYYGPRYGLPPALGTHQTYFLWGPRGYSGNCLIVIDDSRENLERLFVSVEYVGESDSSYAMERHIPVYIAKGAKFGSLSELWPTLKRWR